TDLEIPVSGIPISVTRTYDSLNANTTDDFGYGWRLEFRDTDLRTSVAPPSEEQQLLGRLNGFTDQTRVYVTLPGGKREGFTFAPQRAFISQYIPSVTGYDTSFYEPAFKADAGVTDTLSVRYDGYLNRRPDGTFMSQGGASFNPEDGANFGGVYVLTTKEGIEYEIDAKSGDVLTITDLNGNQVRFDDSGIYSDTGQQVTFKRDAQGRITSVVDPDGNEVVYGYDANGDLVSVTDREQNTTTLDYHDERAHYLDSITDPLGREGVRAQYDEATGRLSQILDINGDGVEIDYDPLNSLQIVKDALGNPTTYEYDPRGNIVQEVDAEGGIITRTYDDRNNLLSETDADGVTVRYTYDNQNNLLSIEDEEGSVTRMTYNSQGRTTSVVTPTGLTVHAKYDDRGNLVESTDADGLTTTYSYNSRGQLRFQTAPDGQVTEYDYDEFGNPNRIVDSRGNEVKADYSASGRLESASSEFELNGSTYTLSQSFTYDDEGRTISSSNSQGNGSSRLYNKLGQITSMTDHLGNTTEYEHNIKGQVERIILPDNTPDDDTDNPVVTRTYDKAGRITSEISPTGLVTRYVYDKVGRLTETILPDQTPETDDDNPRIITDYTKAGRVKSRTDMYGNKEEYRYNELGQLVEMIDVLGNPTTYTYNKGGQIETVTDIRDRTTRYIYDDHARVIETQYFDGSRYALTYDELGRVKTETNELDQTTTYEYDEYGQVNAVINALNERTTFEYDHRRNLVKVTDALQQSTEYEYDQYARQVETRFHNGESVSMGYDTFNRLTSVTDENQHTTTYRHDTFNRITEIEQHNGSTTAYTYDTLGRLTEILDANQHKTAFQYDAFHRETATILPLGQENLTVYNNLGQVESTTDFNGDTITYGYDQYGRLDLETFSDTALSSVSYGYDPVTSQLTSVTDGRGETSYTYDERDRLSTVLNPDGQSITYGYDLLSNVTSLTTQAGTTTYSYDALNRLDTVNDGTELLADYDYNAMGNLTQTTFGNGSVETRQYDERNRLIQLTTENVVGTVFSDFSYTLDGVGNRTQMSELSGRTVNYTFDELNRLVEEEIIDAAAGNRTIGYSYDPVGNRLTRDDSLEGLTTYTYDDNDRLRQTTLSQPNQGDLVTLFDYDDNGSLIGRTSGTDSVTYDWVNDGENRLVSITLNQNGELSQINHEYDGLGDRVSTTVDGTTTYFLSTPDVISQVLLEYDDQGQTITDYTYGLGLVRSREDNTESFYHPDALGSTRFTTDTVGLVTGEYTYDAFGQTLSTPEDGTAFQFAGEQRDGETGLDYLRARYYDADLGRFISKDPFSGFLDDPYSLHDYQYAHANPVNFTDPTGYFTLNDAVAAVTIASQLAIVGSTSFGAGYVLGGYLSGADADEMLNMVGDFGAGFAKGVSGGYLTDVYEAHTGNIIEPDHHALANAGMVAGLGTSMLIGMKLPVFAATAVGPLKWVAVAGVGTDLAFDIYGAASATQNLVQSYRDDGDWEWQDSFNLLSYLPFIGAMGGIRKAIGASKATSGASDAVSDSVVSANNTARQMSRTDVTTSGKCFVAGTEVLTVDGQKNIEDIKVGDWVIADDPTTPGEIEKRQVLETFVRQTDTLIDLTIDGELISTTEEHPFWVVDKGWVDAEDLQIGDLLQTENGTIVDIDQIGEREGDFEVYNFKVDDFHTYYVSDLDILVHNANYFPDKPAGKLTRLDDKWLKRQGADPHEVKDGLPGKPSEFDIYKDTQDELWAVRKGQDPKLSDLPLGNLEDFQN
ncbi:MAG: RHS famlily protein, partial [Cyanothece sp. SIO2G6]|nr:RHS famlily protein [Cyanothece sp. SIO2G6]